MFEGPVPSVEQIMANLDKAWPNGLPDFSNMPHSGIIDYLDLLTPNGSEAKADREIFKSLRDVASKHNITIMTDRFKQRHEYMDQNGEIRIQIA